MRITLLFFALLLPTHVIGADIEQHLSPEAIAALTRADEHQNYCLRYFHRTIEGRDDVVVLMGESHIKKDQDEVERGLQVTKQFDCIGRENGGHFISSLLFNKFDFLMKFAQASMSKASTEGLGSTIHDYSEHIENALALGLSLAVYDLLNEAEKKQLIEYIKFDEELAASIFLGGSLKNYLKIREIDGQSLSAPISKDSLVYWLSALTKKPNLLTAENADLVEQALKEIREGKKNSGPRMVRSQNEGKRGSNIDLELGCRASLSDNICQALNTAWTYGEVLTIPALATWCITGSSYAGTCSGIGLGLIAWDVSFVLLKKLGYLSPQYSRNYYSLGIDSRDSAMAQNIDKFFAEQAKSKKLLAMMGMLHVPGVALHLLNTYGFKEIKPKQR